MPISRRGDLTRSTYPTVKPAQAKAMSPKNRIETSKFWVRGKVRLDAMWVWSEDREKMLKSRRSAIDRRRSIRDGFAPASPQIGSAVKLGFLKMFQVCDLRIEHFEGKRERARTNHKDDGSAAAKARARFDCCSGEKHRGEVGC